MCGRYFATEVIWSRYFATDVPDLLYQGIGPQPVLFRVVNGMESGWPINKPTPCWICDGWLPKTRLNSELDLRLLTIKNKI